MIKIPRNLFSLLLLMCGVIGQVLLTSCKSDTATPKLISEVEILEIFNVEELDGARKPSTLRYKEIKYLENGRLIRQDYYDVDNSLKGIELVKYEGQKGYSNYYSPDSVLLAIYNMEYENDNLVKKSGYDGKSNVLLRTETYSYDQISGLRISKEIYNEKGLLVRKFQMGHDANGNEVGVTVLSNEGAKLGEETFEIAKVDSKNRWLEKWGLAEGVTKTFHRRSFK